jgi:hypothetical protein
MSSDNTVVLLVNRNLFQQNTILAYQPHLTREQFICLRARMKTEGRPTPDSVTIVLLKQAQADC